MMNPIIKYYKKLGLVHTFEPKRGVDDYPKMLESIVAEVNKRQKV